MRWFLFDFGYAVDDCVNDCWLFVCLIIHLRAMFIFFFEFFFFFFWSSVVFKKIKELEMVGKPTHFEVHLSFFPQSRKLGSHVK